MQSVHDQIFAILTPDRQAQVKKNEQKRDQHRQHMDHKRDSSPDNASSKPGGN